MNVSQPDSCHLLEWDSVFFGFKVARISRGDVGEKDLEHAVRWCRSEGVSCVYWLLSGSNVEAFRLAGHFGFQFADMRLELEAKTCYAPVSTNPTAIVRLAVPGDIERLRAIARKAHPQSRFHRDPGFGADKAGELFSIWIEKDCGDPSRVVWVLECEHGHAAGYATCQLEVTGGRMGLLAVDETGRGKGGGAALVDQCLDWFAKSGVTKARLATQGINVAAQRLFQSRGFRTYSCDYWYHLWLPT